METQPGMYLPAFPPPTSPCCNTIPPLQPRSSPWRYGSAPGQITDVSQNHRMVGVGRALCGSPSPALLLKQGLLQQAVQDLVQAGLEYLQRRRFHNLTGQPGPGLRHPQREEVLPWVQTEQAVEAGFEVCFVPFDRSGGAPVASAALVGVHLTGTCGLGPRQ